MRGEDGTGVYVGDTNLRVWTTSESNVLQPSQQEASLNISSTIIVLVSGCQNPQHDVCYFGAPDRVWSECN